MIDGTEGSLPRLTTFGGALLINCAGDGTSRTLLRPGKPLALLIYLAASPTKSASREHLINLLWADSDTDHGLRTLRQTVWQMRQAFGENAIVSEGRDLVLGLPLSCDRDEFLQAVAKGDFNAAVRIYQGPFLPDFGVPGGAEFEHWSDRERDRLHSSYVRASETLIRSELDRGHNENAVTGARRLRDADSARESSWRLLLEALVSSGDTLSALTEADELERWLAADDREPERPTVAAISRARKLQPHDLARSPDKLIPELTGREFEFSRLTSSWAAVKRGEFRHIHVSAPAGMGKTRLLHDVFVRLRAKGARAVIISALHGDRKLAYALAGDIVAQLGAMPGASGISSAAASSLVALNPSLSSSFAASADRSDGEEALRRRIHAIAELIDSISEEAAFALFIDDLHWADPVSHQLIHSVFSRATSARMLLVTSARKVPGGELTLPSTETLSLPPLTADQVGELIAGFGSLPKDQWVDRFLSGLVDQTGGSPLLVLENLHLALERGFLRLHDNKWDTGDEEELIAGVSHGYVLEQRFSKIEPRLFDIILLLAIAEESIPIAVVALATEHDRSSLFRDLGALDQQAFVSSSDKGWRCSHDIIAETAVRLAGQKRKAEMHARLGFVLARSAEADQYHLSLAIRHLIAGDRPADTPAIFKRLRSIARASGDRRSNVQLASAILGEARPSELSRQLAASLPLFWRFEPSRTAFVGIPVAALLIFFATSYLVPPKPAQLAIITPPLSGTSNTIVPSPVIEIQDKKGRRVTGATDSVTVSALSGVLDGTLTVPSVKGRAVFKDLFLVGERNNTRLRFAAKGLIPATAPGINVQDSYSTLRLVSATINGQTITSRQRTVVVRPSAEISGVVRLEYSSFWASASVILGATATWGDRTRNFRDLAPLSTPAVDQPRRASIQFIAPATPGLYHIVVAFDAEGNVEDFMSATNWTNPEPIWNDGNDVVDWTPEQLAHANARGWVPTNLLKINDKTNRVARLPHQIPATVIDVVVR